MKPNLKKLFIITFSELICALAISFFFIPHKLLSGGVSGIAVFLQYVTGLSSGIFILLINIPIFVFGFKKLSKRFMYFTLYSTILLSLLLMVLKKLDLDFYIEDTLLSAIFGGVFNGIGMGTLFKNASSQGGFDIIAIVCRKEKNLSISSVLMALNFFVVSISSFLFGIQKGMYTLISMYIAYQVVDKVVSGFDTKKQVIIISEKSNEIAKKILVDPHRGVTLLQAKGAYTGQEKEVIYCVAENRQIAKIKQVVKEFDDKAFISISDMIEVKGKGFVQAEIG